MITFLNSLILGALAAGLIPLLIHLFNKQKTKKILFSSLRFLKMLEKQRLKKVKLYQFLLILIRTLIIIFLVLAFARPTLTGEWTITQNASARSTAVIILDDGLNMRQYDTAGNRFNRALINLENILKSFNPEDKIVIIKSSIPEIHTTRDFDVNSTECSYYIGDFPKALNEAKSIFKNNPNLNNELFIISDFQTLTKNAESKLVDFDKENVFFVNIAQAGDGNVSIDTVAMLNVLPEINKPVNFQITLRNHSANNVREVNTHLFIENKRVAQTNTVVPSMESKSLKISFQPKFYGKQRGYIEIDDDDLLADNKYFFSLNIPENIRLLFVDSQPSSYLNAAIETINKRANLEITTENYNTLARQSFSNFDIICLSNFVEITSRMSERLGSFIENGGNLIIIPGTQSIIKSFNNNLSQYIGNLKIKNLISHPNETDYFTFKTLSINNPLLSGIFRNETSNLSYPKFYKYYKLLPSKDYQKVIMLNSGDPFLVKSTVGQSNVVALSSYFDSQWSNLQIKGLFIPFFVRMIKLAASNPAQHGSGIAVGTELILNLDNFNERNSYQLIMPNEEKNQITPSFSKSNFFINLNSFNKPGNYKVEENNKTVSIISSNVKATRIQAAADIEKISEKYDNINIIDENENILDYVTEARFGEELWKYAIVFVIIFLLLESIIVKKIEGRA